MSATIVLCALAVSCARAAGGGRSEGAGGTPASPAPVAPSAAPAVGRATPGEAARVLSGIVRRFCAEDAADGDLIRWFAPDGAIEAGGVLLPGGKAFVIRNEVVVSLNVGDGPTSPYGQVIWWMKPAAAGDPIREIHVAADSRGRVLPYADLVAALDLGEATETEQGGHPLADLLHRHSFSCGPDRALDLTINEIVWAEPFVGKVGELTLTRRPPGVEAAPEDDAGAADAPALDAAVAADDGGTPRCDIVVEGVLEAQVYRGSGVELPPDLSPAMAAVWMAEDHGENHLQCTYRVRINGAAYAYEEIADQGFIMAGPELDPGLCSQARHQAEVVRHLRIVTDCGSSQGLHRSDLRLRAIPGRPD